MTTPERPEPEIEREVATWESFFQYSTLAGDEQLSVGLGFLKALVLRYRAMERERERLTAALAAREKELDSAYTACEQYRNERDEWETRVYRLQPVADAAEQRVKLLEANMRNVVPTCDAMHHAKKDQNHLFGVCPVVERFKAALNTPTSEGA